ncbi:MAG: cadmium resistance transporter [Oscillospiraceae bacterium]
MPGFIAVSVIAFVSTNIDNIFVMMLLYSQVGGNFKKSHLVAGQYLGLGLLVLVSLLGAVGLHFVPQQYIGLLGFVPIALGLKEWISYKRTAGKAAPPENTAKPEAMEKSAAQTQASSRRGRPQAPLLKAKTALAKIIKPEVFTVTLVTVSNGADNIGVYVPLFTGYTVGQVAATLVVFSLMMALWCFGGGKMANLPGIKLAIQKYRHIAVPVIFVALGIYILLKSCLAGRP